MPVLPLPPLLLADIGEWIGLAILLLTVLGWIVNAIKGNAPDGKPAARPGRRDLRTELEVFLEELQGNKPAPQPEPPRKPARPPQPVAKNPPPPKPRPDKKPPPRRVQPSTTAAAEPGQVSPIGSGVREHVAAYMAPDRVAAHAQQHVGERRIDKAVEQDLGGGTVAPVAPAEQPRGKPHPLLAALAQPSGMRQAILMQEILQKPRALRR
uniref:Uncharacterized protein n=1 Tax=Schlesneria paludicola TaxID=360056 RepID=A0A7C2PFX2_9PLAN